jgi:anhydro-N-acetylmuramic acid kinase
LQIDLIDLITVSIKASHVKYKVIGLMSGTSLDGLDIAFCEFENIASGWTYKIRIAETIPYPEEWRNRLVTLEKGSAHDFATTDIEYGQFTGRLTKSFIDKHNIRPDFIASHGHTVFHQPEKGVTWQIGKGSSIAAETSLPVVCDFRSLDVALGGQGAPLVPAGDRLLFGEFDFCLNLGGFANISYEEGGERIAFDICPVNIVLNHLTRKIGQPFDPSGEMARIGNLSHSLLTSLNQLPYYDQPPPKSLGKEWVLSHIFPVLDHSQFLLNDQLNTYCEHVAMQIAKSTSGHKKGKILTTGGGAFNEYLIDRIKQLSQHNIILPDENTINFKEALIFAFLGVLRWRKEVNCLRSVTGAAQDTSGGSIYFH